MNGKASITKTTDKTMVSSEADISSDDETTITKTTNQNTESSGRELSSDEETNSASSKRKPSEISSPELQPQPKIANFNTLELTPEEQQSTSLSESDKLVVVEARQRIDELNSTYISNTTNVTKDLHMDISDDETERNLDAVDGHKIIETSKLVLPTLKEVIDEEGLENGNSEKRIAKKGDVRPGCSEFTSWLS